MAIGDIELRGTAYAKNGRDRLKLLYVLVTEDGGADFHSLVWERRKDAEWTIHFKILEDDFQWQHPYRRWVADIHSLSPMTDAQ